MLSRGQQTFSLLQLLNSAVVSEKGGVVPIQFIYKNKKQTKNTTGPVGIIVC